MIQIDNTLVSLDVITRTFCCDLSRCRGVCCVYGESGAPLEKDESILLDEILPTLRPYLRPEGLNTIAEQGTSLVDADGDVVTPLINNRECAYTIIDKGIYKCGIERAYEEKKIGFQKPISCHLYPIRIQRYDAYDAVNYENWSHCNPAIERGEQQATPVYLFLKDALIRKYGKPWYKSLVTIAKEYQKSQVNHT